MGDVRSLGMNQCRKDCLHYSLTKDGRGCNDR